MPRSTVAADPRKFRVIKDSWNSTDRQDARNPAKALWVHVVAGEFGIPTAHRPAAATRELRRLFASESRLGVLKEMSISAASHICRS